MKRTMQGRIVSLLRERGVGAIDSRHQLEGMKCRKFEFLLHVETCNGLTIGDVVWENLQWSYPSFFDITQNPMQYQQNTLNVVAGFFEIEAYFPKAKVTMKVLFAATVKTPIQDWNLSKLKELLNFNFNASKWCENYKLTPIGDLSIRPVGLEEAYKTAHHTPSDFLLLEIVVKFGLPKLLSKS